MFACAGYAGSTMPDGCTGPWVMAGRGAPDIRRKCVSPSRRPGSLRLKARRRGTRLGKVGNGKIDDRVFCARGWRGS
ncbi:hypothetical protein KCP70_05010 [Salmonella enterica subsp. enterica]|nr:hypothetical protein KCP70_05010 [Salmonella enterica subsp. enterica]